MQRVTRFSGADWAPELRQIYMVGAGGINSWTALNLSSIGHSIVIFDADMVDSTNVEGGQMFRRKDVDNYKVQAVEDICREFGCISPIEAISSHFVSLLEGDIDNICVCGVDNMAARRETFESWVRGTKEKSPSLFIDGRLTMEMHEVFAIHNNKPEQIEEYLMKHLFSDEESVELDCTTKQSRFCAMGISEKITATLCNWLVNQKLGEEFREVPFYQKTYLPIFLYKKEEVESRIVIEEEKIIKPKRAKKVKTV